LHPVSSIASGFSIDDIVVAVADNLLVAADIVVAVGIAGDAGVRGSAQQPRLFVGMILIMIFSEVLGLYGFIVALILDTKSSLGQCPA